VVTAGVYDALSARLAERAGFEVLFLSGYGVAASLLGEPDFGLLTQTELLETARRVIRAVDVPVIVDGDTGHAGPLNVQRLVRELVALGAGSRRLHDRRSHRCASAARPRRGDPARAGLSRGGRGRRLRRGAPEPRRAEANRHLDDVYRTLRAQGTSRSVADRLMGFAAFGEVVGLEEKYALEARYRP
jgi:2-methylisocitrate lyase-like PEP mutase family enzyme